MTHQKRWESIRELGRGGQGTVALVRDRTKWDAQSVHDRLRTALRQLSSSVISEKQNAVFSEFRDLLSEINEGDAPKNLGALKQLHAAADARDPERAKERIQRELKAMSEAAHPNLLKVLDSDSVARWFVTEYHPGGTLASKLELSKGDAEKALQLIRPLVSAVQLLHERNIVHRDIKPQNIFISSEQQFILGDFGLVYFDDDRHTRLSGTLENVGTRDWMPGWAMGIRVEDVRPSFDVFALGKVLWSLVSGRPILQLWYYNRPQNDLVALFPDSPFMDRINRILEQCIVEDEENCLPDAGKLLAEIDSALESIRGRATVFDGARSRKCIVCAVGRYVEMDRHELINSGIGSPSGQRMQKVFTCSSCGHVQQFITTGSKTPDLWNFVV